MRRTRFPYIGIANDRISSYSINSVGEVFRFICIPRSYGVRSTLYCSYGYTERSNIDESRVGEVIQQYELRGWDPVKPRWIQTTKMLGFLGGPCEKPHEDGILVELVEWIREKVGASIIFMEPHHNVCELDIYIDGYKEDPGSYQNYLLRIMKEKLRELAPKNEGV